MYKFSFLNLIRVLKTFVLLKKMDQKIIEKLLLVNKLELKKENLNQNHYQNGLKF